jgi:hypothetical protein
MKGKKIVKIIKKKDINIRDLALTTKKFKLLQGNILDNKYVNINAIY